MTNIAALIGKELRAYFFSPIAYVLITGFLAMSSWFFITYVNGFPVWVAQAKQADNTELLAALNVNEFVIKPVLENMTILLLVFVPMITMRLLAEERREGTDQLLHTSPMTTAQIIAGKYISSLIFTGILLSPSILFMIAFISYGDPERGMMYMGFTGLAVTALVFSAIGLFTSSLTENQIVAAVSCFLIELLFFTVGWGANIIGNRQVGEVLSYLSLKDHLANFTAGVVYSTDVIFVASVVAIFLFLSARSIESSRWR